MLGSFITVKFPVSSISLDAWMSIYAVSDTCLSHRFLIPHFKDHCQYICWFQHHHQRASTMTCMALQHVNPCYNKHSSWTSQPLVRHTHLCQQWRSHLWEDTARQPTTSQLQPCFLPGRPSPACAGTPLSVVCLADTSTAPGEGVRGHEGSCTPLAQIKAAGDGLPSLAVVTDAGYVCECGWGSRHS